MGRADKEIKNSYNPSWFADALSAMGVVEGPGWPDRFGDEMSSWINKNHPDKINILSLFTGAGGLDIGFHDSGFHSTEMVEFEKKFVATLEENSREGGRFSGSKPMHIDVREYDPKKSLKADFIVGGPPCQTFSSAGRRASGVLGTSDPRGMLFMEYVRLLKKLKPKGFLFENVYGITGADGGKAWEDIQKAFKEAGYKIFFRVLDAADYGVPQHRERLFIVGLREGTFKFPYPTHGPDSKDGRPHYSAGLATKNVTSSEALKRVNGRYGYLLDGIPPGLNYSFYTKKMGHPNPVFAWRSKFSDFLYKADPAVPVRAIKAQGGQYTGPFSWENRYFTIAELKRLQTFPDNFDLVGGHQVAVQQIGNSVPPQIGRIMALAILDQVFKVDLPFRIDYMPDDFELSFRKHKRLQTQSYQDKALEAIGKLSAKVQKPARASYSMVRYLGDNFSWTADAHKSKASLKIEVNVSTKNRVLELSVGHGNSNPAFTFDIMPKKEADWDLNYEKVSLVSYSKEKKNLVALWKAFEEISKNESGSADLVQLSGYYQSTPQISATLNINFKDSSGFWKLLKSVTETSGSVQLDLEQLSFYTKLPGEKLLPLLKDLRMHGYEIRNRNTNPQIHENTYLIPYFFPTLRPDSVQLKKSL